MKPGDRVEHHTIGVPATVVLTAEPDVVLVRFDREYKPWEIFKTWQLSPAGAREQRKANEQSNERK